MQTVLQSTVGAEIKRPGQGQVRTDTFLGYFYIWYNSFIPCLSMTPPQQCINELYPGPLKVDMEQSVLLGSGPGS